MLRFGDYHDYDWQSEPDFWQSRFDIRQFHALEELFLNSAVLRQYIPGGNVVRLLPSSLSSLHLGLDRMVQGRIGYSSGSEHTTTEDLQISPLGTFLDQLSTAISQGQFPKLKRFRCSWVAFPKHPEPEIDLFLSGHAAAMFADSGVEYEYERVEDPFPISDSDSDEDVEEDEEEDEDDDSDQEMSVEDYNRGVREEERFYLEWGHYWGW